MKIAFRVILAAFAAILFSSCAETGSLCVDMGPFGSANIGGPPRGYGGPQRQFTDHGHSGPPGCQIPGDGHGGPPGQRSQEGRIVDNGGFYSKNKWQNGVNEHTYSVKVGVSSFNHALTESEKVGLANNLEAWAVAKVKDGGRPPTDADVTAEAQRRVGHNRVRAKVENNFSENFISQERKLVSREKVEAEDVPEPSRSGLQNQAQENFYKNRTNEIVKDDKFYPN